MISKNKIKLFKSLQQKKYREIENKFIVEGKKIVEEAYSFHKQHIEEILCTRDSLNSIPPEFHPITQVCTIEELKKISSLKTPQNILAVLKKPVHPQIEFEKLKNLILALDAIRDPGNLGTIIRLADWFGVNHIVCSKDCVDAYNPKTVQASMGAILRMRISYVELDSFLWDANEKNFRIYGATLEGKNLYKTKLDEKSILVMGNESEGISDNVRKTLTNELFIPNYSSNKEKTESLNVSIATSVILSEFRRVFHYSK